jgi:hypothetical protein
VNDSLSEDVKESPKTLEILTRPLQNTKQYAVNILGRIQRKLGENYFAILEENPVIINTLSRTDLLTDNKELFSTVFNIPWMTTFLWTAFSGSAISMQHPIGKVVGNLLHYDPGHIQNWDKINKFMDSVSGSGHRLKFGHSIDYLPQIIEKFGAEGIPAYFMHLAQDYTTVSGIPVVPYSWEIKNIIQFIEERQKKVLKNITASLRALGLVAQYDEKTLRPKIDIIRKLWASELLLPGDIDTVLSMN